MFGGVHRLRTARYRSPRRSRSRLNRQHGLNFRVLIGAQNGLILSGLTRPPLLLQNLTSRPIRCAKSIHKWLNWRNCEAKTLSPGIAYCRGCLPSAGAGRREINTCPSLFEDFLQILNKGSVNLNLEDPWSSIATIMARVTRSGTLVGPGTKRKWRPAMMYPPIVCRLTLLAKPMAQAQQSKLRARFCISRPSSSKPETSFGQGDRTGQGALPQPRKDGAEIVHIGEGWPGHHQISNRRKEAVAIIVGEPCLRRYAVAARARLSGPMSAPALSSVPSIPSVSPANA